MTRLLHPFPLLLVLLGAPLAVAADGFLWQGEVASLGHEFPTAASPRKLDILARLAANTDRAIEVYRLALADSDPDVQVAAATALGLRRNAEAELLLVARLASAPTTVRRAIVTSLARQQTDRAFQVLLRSLSDSEATVRAAAIAGLRTGRIRIEWTEALARRLTDESAEVRIEAIAALAQTQDARMGATIATRLKDHSPEVAAAAARAVATLLFRPAVPTLLAMVRDQGQLSTVRDALRSLGLLGDDQTLNALASLYGHYDRLRPDLAIAMGQIAARYPDAATPTLMLFADDLASPTARLAITAASAAAVPFLLRIIESRTPRDVSPAVELLAVLGDDRATDVLLAEANKKRVAPTIVAAALGQTKSPRVAPTLLQYLASDDEGLQLAALTALSEIPWDVAYDKPLQRSLTSPSESIRIQGAKLLGNSVETSTHNELQRLALFDGSLAVRVASLGSLAVAANDDQVRALWQALDTAPPLVADAIAVVLGARGTRETAALIAQAVGRRPIDERHARLVRALDDLVLRKQGDGLRLTTTAYELLSSPRLDVAEAAAGLLASLSRTGNISRADAAPDIPAIAKISSIDILVAAMPFIADTNPARVDAYLESTSDRLAAAAAWECWRLPPNKARLDALVSLVLSNRKMPAINASAALVRMAESGGLGSLDSDVPQAAMANHPSALVRGHAALFAKHTKKPEALGRLVDDPSIGVRTIAKQNYVSVPRSWRVIALKDPAAPLIKPPRQAVFIVGADGVAWSGFPTRALELRFPEFAKGPAPVRALEVADMY